MFNTYSPTQKVNVNAVSGTLSKTCEKSFFKYAQIGSDLIKMLMSDEPRVPRNSDRFNKQVVILQAMCISDNYMMFELMWKDDFDKLNEESEG